MKPEGQKICMPGFIEEDKNQYRFSERSNLKGQGKGEKQAEVL